MPDPLLPGKAGLYVSMMHYGLTHNRDFAHEHYAFFKAMLDYLGPIDQLRALDVGCGKSFWLTLLLRSAGALVTGIDTEVVEPGLRLEKYRRIKEANGLERALRTFIWEIIFARPYYRELAAVLPFRLNFDNIDVRKTDGTSLPFADNTFDLVVSHEVFEHIEDVAAVVKELSRVLHPDGRTYIYVHNFTSLSGGHHIAWKYPDREPSKSVPPWDHLRKRQHVDIPSWLNEKREHEYRPIFAEYFNVLDWFSIGNEGQALLDPAIRAELSHYSEEELLSKGFVVVAKPKSESES